MNERVRRVWAFLKEDSWQSWIVSLLLTFLFIKFIFFPALAWALAAPLPLVVVESCSMYHESGFDSWWNQNAVWYENHNITRAEFAQFPFKNGLNKGDIVIVSGRGRAEKGDIIIFRADFTYPLIHRLMQTNVLSTKGDHNFGQLPQEERISNEAVIGHAVARIPFVGWLKLIFFEGLKSADQRGFCH